MAILPHTIFDIVVIGAGATIAMDAWLLLLKRLGVPISNFAMIGRWVGHLLQGRVRHAAIARSSPIPAERLLGWLTHYAVGIAYAALLVAMQGPRWSQQPSLAPALAVGIGTVLVPLFVMQPAMGAGMAGSMTPSPWKNCLRSVANHTVFGLGLYLAAAALASLASLPALAR